jgi:hypothetical protein
MSLKGMRRELRKSGFRTEVLVRDIESEVVNWLQAGGTVLAPDAFESAGTLDLELATAVGQTGTIFEISRTPLRLIWYIVDDAFARYIVHCCARYHEIVSFSQYPFVSGICLFNNMVQARKSQASASPISFVPMYFIRIIMHQMGSTLLP